MFAQFGDLVSVDIYHTDPRHPRFAYVQYQTMESGQTAIDTLHQKAIDFGTEYAIENKDDLSGWAGWQGGMTVVRNEQGRFIPTAVQELFPDVATWMVGGDKKRERESEEYVPIGPADDSIEKSPKRARPAPDFTAELSNLVTKVETPQPKLHASLPPKPVFDAPVPVAAPAPASAPAPAIAAAVAPAVAPADTPRNHP